MKIEETIFNNTRWKILKFIWGKESTNSAEIEKSLKLGHATVFHHIEKLTEAGILDFNQQTKKQGRPVRVSISDRNKLIEKMECIILELKQKTAKTKI